MDGTMRRVLVGYDGSDHAERALRWAAGEAARRGSRLDVVTVVDDDVMGIRGPVGMAHWWPEVAVADARRIAARGVDVARQGPPELEVSAVGLTGLPAAVLIEASREADLVVLGTRGRTLLAEMALGSVAERVAAHAYCPVVVVHGDAAVHPGPAHPVIVGVDDSTETLKALEVAADWAQEAGAALTVACAWSLAAFWDDEALTSAQSTELRTRASEAARRAVDAAVAHALELHPDLTVTGKVIRGAPARALAEEADGAGLVAVGSRGRGAFTSLVLGSVSHALVRTAPCAVAVVGERAPAARREEPRTAARAGTPAG